MGKSLQEQLLGAGIVDTNKVKTAKANKRKQNKQQHNRQQIIKNDTAELAKKAQADKAERDRKLNKQRAKAAEQKAIYSQIRQLIVENRQATDDAEEAFNFVHANKVKRIYINQALRDQIGVGKMAIVKCGTRYDVVNSDIARKIAERDEACVVLLNDGKNSQIIEDDSYGQYQVPDDLMW